MNIHQHHITAQRSRRKTWIPVLLVLLKCMTTTLLFASCTKDDAGSALDATDTYLSLNVQTTTPYMSRAVSDTTAANPDQEGKIYSIRVWAFNSSDTDDDALPLSYKEENLGATGATTKTISMKIPRTSGGNELKKLDLYILGNSESITDLFKDESSMKLMTRAKLAALTISKNFGIASAEGTETTAAQCTEVPGTGLPVSRVITGIQATQYETEEEAAKNAVQIPLIRAVSKLHFFFARKSNAGTDNVTITRIVMGQNVLPTESKVFPTSTTLENKDTQGLIGEFGSDTQYISSTMTMGGVATNEIAAIADPTTLFRKENENAQAYMTRLRAATTEKDLSYLRESNKALTGKIYYKLDASATDKSIDFTIPSEEGIAAYRNHELVVYGYFLDGGSIELALQYYVADWITKNPRDITFN